MRMPFGKHKGEFLDELPDDYIEWLGSLDNLFEPFASALEDEYVDRFGREPPLSGGAGKGRRRGRADNPPRRSSTPFPKELRGVAWELLKRGKRAMARHYHPDREGGDEDLMKDLNRAVEEIEKRLDLDG